MATSNLLANWWRSRQFSAALKQGKTRLAEELLHQIQKSGARLSWVEKVFKDKLQFEQSSRDYRQQLAAQYRHISQLRQKLEGLDPNQQVNQPDVDLLTPDAEFVKFISNSFKLVEHDKTMLQCTGIEQRVFEEFEHNLVDFIKDEFNKISKKKSFALLLEDAIEDITLLKSGKDPQYRFELSPHVYLMRYFLENIYCAYLAWFLIYKSGLLPTKINILDIAAGPGTVAYGLALLLQSSSSFFPIPPMHISYYSLEQQKSFQYRGLQFWRKYIESQETATNAYFRFDTSSIFDYDPESRNIPHDFFDLVVISHCFFNDAESRSKSQTVYNEIFTNCLKENGYVLLIIQDKKLFMHYGIRQSESQIQEEGVAIKFVEELGLNLVWYKYLTSTDRREQIPNFARFAKENLASQKYMSSLLRQYFKLKYDLHYKLDDYVILAKK